MRRIAVAIRTAGLLVTLSVFLTFSRAQNNNAERPVRPNQGAVIGGPNTQASPVPSLTLQCQGCHGAGKQRIALAIHFYEAVLATLAIMVWHFYHVIFDPDVYPVNFALLDGRVSEELFREEHQLAFEQMKKQIPTASKSLVPSETLSGTAD